MTDKQLDALRAQVEKWDTDEETLIQGVTTQRLLEFRNDHVRKNVKCSCRNCKLYWTADALSSVAGQLMSELNQALKPTTPPTKSFNHEVVAGPEV